MTFVDEEYGLVTQIGLQDNDKPQDGTRTTRLTPSIVQQQTCPRPENDRRLEFEGRDYVLKTLLYILWALWSVSLMTFVGGLAFNDGLFLFVPRSHACGSYNTLVFGKDEAKILEEYKTDQVIEVKGSVTNRWMAFRTESGEHTSQHEAIIVEYSFQDELYGMHFDLRRGEYVQLQRGNNVTVILLSGYPCSRRPVAHVREEKKLRCRICRICCEVCVWLAIPSFFLLSVFTGIYVGLMVILIIEALRWSLFGIVAAWYTVSVPVLIHFEREQRGRIFFTISAAKRKKRSRQGQVALERPLKRRWHLCFAFIGVDRIASLTACSDSKCNSRAT